MNGTEQTLVENAREYFKNAMKAESDREFNSAATLYFKALSALSDLIILRKKGHIPSSHTDRFRILETSFPEIYETMDKDFPFYQDSYRIKITKEVSVILREDAKKLSETAGIRLQEI